MIEFSDFSIADPYHARAVQNGRYAVRAFISALLALAVAGSPALACKGEEIFSDDFQEDSGLWDKHQDLKIGGGFLELTVRPTSTQLEAMAVGVPDMNLAEFDICVDVTYPTGKPNTAGGIIFWFKDWQNIYLLGSSPDGTTGAVSVIKGKSVRETPFRKFNQVRAGAGAKNNFRVTAKGNSLTMYANDQRIANIRGAPTVGALGFYAEAQKGNGLTIWKFSDLKLSEPPK
jgi:hypothetical protein